jgi:hypothetical protein
MYARFALVAELADAQRSERCELYARRGSNPLEGTHYIRTSIVFEERASIVSHTTRTNPLEGTYFKHRARVVKLVYTQS